jgi:CRP-like cAMP-binding protein
MNIAKNSQKIKIKNNENLINEDEITNFIYFIIEGKIICYKNNIVIKIYKQNEIFGEIYLFNQIESFYGYFSNSDSILIKINILDLIEIYKESTIENISHNIFKNIFKEKKKHFFKLH